MTRGLQARFPTITEQHAEFRRAQLRRLSREQLEARFASVTGRPTRMTTVALIDYLVWEEPPIAFTGADGDLVE